MTSPAPSVASFVEAEAESVTAFPTSRPRTEAEDLRIARAVNQYFGLVWRSLRRFGVAQANADDAAQQVFLIFSRRLSSVLPLHERAFLLSVAVRVAANTRRAAERSREVLAGDEPAELLACEDDPEQLLAQKQRRAELDRALADLSHEQRVVFVLYELEGFSLPEIAAILAVPLGTATSRLTRGRERFEHWVLSQHSTRELP
jgi:RNA polymerase sigma-70 factor (ECF subfamily)